jgi:uncharacterized repeat protein (TIGR02543 family)
MNKAVQGAARLAVIFYAVLLLFTGCPDLFHDKEPEKPKEYTVTFDAAGGSPETQIQTVTEGRSLDSANMPLEPGRDGYIFSGWYTDVDGEGSEFNAGTTVNEDITIYARWRLQYTVTFNAAGGSPDPQTRTAADGASLDSGMPPAPSREGYIFSGWYTEAESEGSEFSAGTIVSGNITVYARWSLDTSIQYMVTFDAAGGSPATQTRTVTNGASLDSSGMPPAPSQDGYIFDGWYTGAEGEGSEFSAGTIVSGNITVYARWSLDTSIQYTVTFDAAGGSPATQTRTVTNGASLGSSGMPSAPTRSGYNFSGWYTGVEGEGSEYNADTPVSADIRVYAWWKYMVTFDADGGNPPIQTRTAANGDSLGFSGMPSAPTRSGYNFGGWYTTVNGGGSEFTAATTISGNIRVYAWWTTYSYTVSFEKNGGDTEAVPATKTVASPSVNVGALPVPPTRTTYIFDGWYTGPDGGGNEFTASTAVTGDITVYARWTGETYTVTFKSNYGANETLYTKTVTVPATTIADFPAPPSRSGYTFGGWNTQAEGGGSGFSASTAVSGNITIYAKWTLDTSIQYTVTFDAAGGSPATQTRTVTNGSSLGSSNMPSTPSRAAYIFNGWYTAVDSGGSEFTATATVSGDITVYARWSFDTSIQYTVTFDAAGGSPATQTRTVTNGSSLGSSNMPSTPGRSGYIFSGWYTQAEGGGSVFTASTTVTGNITIYAKWTGQTYTVTFKSNYGTNETLYTRTVTVPATTITDFPANPSRTGYSFDGWYAQADGGGSEFTAAAPVTGDIMVYARWGMPDNLSLNDALTWISANAVTGRTYIITVRNDETIAPKSLSYSGKTVGITLSGGTTERTVSLSTTGSLFTVGSGVTLTLDNNVTLQGRGGNTGSLVLVMSGGTFVMNDGSKISGNTCSSYSSSPYGGGVYVGSSGTFTMNGGTISDNTTHSISYSSPYGGGVHVGSSGTFTMNGGTISDNTASYANSSRTLYGGGVSVFGTFTMSGGEISSNTASSFSYGGGVYVDSSGTFTMSGGTISDNTSSNGGGVSVWSDGTFTMSNGTITGNTAAVTGGGVYVGSEGTFTMNGGTISDNTSSNGGGVYGFGGTFIMSGGTITGNTASSYGGGVYVSPESMVVQNGIFIMSDGTISGNTASSYGGGVYVYSTFTMSGGEISGNTASSDSSYSSSYSFGGGGVFVRRDGGTFTMSGGTISDNTASYSYSAYGGGVSVSGTFTMSGGEISGNTASSSFSSSYGGGVYVWSDGTFTKQSGGVIYGSNESNSALRNTATGGDGSGHAMYVNSSPAKKRDATAGTGVTLDSTKDGAAGGWE